VLNRGRSERGNRGARLHPEALVLARHAQFHICSPTGEQGPRALPMTDAVPYKPIGCIHELVQARVVLLHAEVCEIVALRYVRSWH
jgi:hypothetical protein